MTENNKNWKIVVVVLLVIWGLWITFRGPGTNTVTQIINKAAESVGLPAPTLSSLGGETGVDVLCMNETSSAKVCWSWARGSIKNSTTTDFWANNTGNDVILDNVEMYYTTKASSTMIVWAATSTNATTTVGDYLDPIIGSPGTSGRVGVSAFVIASTTIATGTQPIVFNNFFNAGVSGLNSSVGNPYGAQQATSTFLVKNGEGIIFALRSGANSCTGPWGPVGALGVTNRSCESATSSTATTSPGFINWSVRYHYYK